MTFLKFSILALTAALASAQDPVCENDDWCIHFEDVTTAQIGDNTGPNIVISYKDTPAPATTPDVKKYSSTLMTVVGDTCGAEAGDGTTAFGVTINTGDAAWAADKWTVPIALDAGAAETAVGGFATNVVGNTFDIKFCVKTDLLTEVTGAGDMAVDSASTIFTFTVDKEQGFSIASFATSPDGAVLDTDNTVTVNIPVAAAFCNAAYAADPVTAAKPGQALAFCVSATGATIEKLINVKFSTSDMDGETPAPKANIPITDGTGAGVGLSSVDCPTTGDGIGQCRVSTVAYARVFERIEAGALEDISGTAIITGTAVLDLAGRRVLKEVSFRGSNGNARVLQEDDKTPVNSFDMDVAGSLSPPPERSSAPATAVAFVSMMMTGLVGLLI